MKYRLGLTAEPLTDRINNKLEGVGMIRSEYLCRNIEEYITLESCRRYIIDYVENVANIFSPQDIWYRTTELVTKEVNVLRGADYIIDEKHYTFGLRGVRRGLKFRDAFLLELEMVTSIYHNHENVGILFPYIYDPYELELCLELLQKVGYNGKYGIMAEIPSAILLLEDFLKLGITNVTIGVNDLTTLTLGTYRDSQYFSHNHPSLIKLIKDTVKICSQYSVPVSVGGYVSKELAKNCEEIGIDWFIIHYSDLHKVFDVETSKLPYLDLVNQIKKLTKSRIKQREIINVLNTFEQLK